MIHKKVPMRLCENRNPGFRLRMSNLIRAFAFRGQSLFIRILYLNAPIRSCRSTGWSGLQWSHMWKDSFLQYLGRTMRKPVVGHMRTAKAQVSLRIRTVWSGPPLSANRIIGYYRIITKTRLFKYIENLTTKNWKFSDKNSDIFHISAQHRLWVLIEAVLTSTHNLCFLSRNNKKNVYPCKTQLYYIKVGFKGGQNYIGMFSWWLQWKANARMRMRMCRMMWIPTFWACCKARFHFKWRSPFNKCLCRVEEMNLTNGLFKPCTWIR